METWNKTVGCISQQAEEVEQQMIDSLQLTPRSQTALEEWGIRTLGRLAAVLSGEEQKVSFLRIGSLGELNRIEIIRKAIRKGIITADKLGRYSTDKRETGLWECYRLIMKDYQ